MKHFDLSVDTELSLNIGVNLTISRRWASISLGLLPLFSIGMTMYYGDSFRGVDGFVDLTVVHLDIDFVEDR